MSSWQPPIPSGALYSPAAIALGPGLALLAWCYDQIERDGSVQIQLEKAAADLGKPYGTVRDWWKDIKEGSFFTDITPQGRKGWRAKFKAKWIDWRIQEKNYPDRRDFSDESPNTADISANKPSERNISDESPNGDGLSDFSSQFDRRDFSDQGSAYKVLMTPDQAPPPPTKNQPPRATGGGGGATHEAPNETELLLLNFTPPFSVGAAREFRHFPADAVRAELQAAAAAGSGPGSLVARWRRVPPTSAQPTPATQSTPVPSYPKPPERPATILTAAQKQAIARQIEQERYARHD